MSDALNKQQALWTGAFGDEYAARNAVDPDAHARLVEVWRTMLAKVATGGLSRVVEVGANIGRNLRALAEVTTAELTAVEPNAAARARLVADGVVAPERAVEAFASALPFEDGFADLVFTSGVLIHVAPEDLEACCREIVRVSRRYVLCVEYFSDSPREIPYRGHTGALFLRDFGEAYLAVAPELKVVDYGFLWRRTTGQDNPTWWLFEKP